MRITLKNPNEFRKIIIVHGYSQTDLARAVEITPSYLNQILNEERFPSGKVAKRIAGELNLEFHDIFFINDACKSYQD